MSTFDIFTLGNFREKTRDLPDNTIIVGEFEEEFKWNEIGEIKILPAVDVLEHSPVVMLYGGQVVNYEFDLDSRYDASQI